MDFKFDKGPAGDAAAQGQDKGRQTMLLVVLLRLVMLTSATPTIQSIRAITAPKESPRRTPIRSPLVGAETGIDIDCSQGQRASHVDCHNSHTVAQDKMVGGAGR